MGILHVFIPYKVVAYICAYLLKTEDVCSYAMNDALKDGFERELDNYEQKKYLNYDY